VEIIASTKHRALVFAGGGITVTPPPDPDAFVVGCDGGYDHAVRAGLAVDLLIGDLDSISPEGLAHAEQAGVTIERHPRDKDQTDFELAVDACLASNIREIDIYGGEGGRIDHLLGLATALGSHRWRGATLRWHTATGTVQPMVGPNEAAFSVEPSATVSLVPVTDCAGVTTTGAVWPLTDAALPAGTSRGLSNTTTGAAFTVTIGSGALLVITTPHPPDQPDR
jgi:thiamine pyrophosphokinase